MKMDIGFRHALCLLAEALAQVGAILFSNYRKEAQKCLLARGKDSK